MPNRPLIFRTATLTSAVESANNTETVVATLAGVTCEYDGSTVRLHGWAKITTGTGTTGGILRIRRDSLTGTVVSDATSETGPFVASKTFDASIDADDGGRSLAGATYVLTHIGVGDTSAATYLAATLTAEIFQRYVLNVIVASAVGANTPFVFTVPAQRRWRVFSVCAAVTRAVGGTPNRSYQLALSDGTTTFLTSPAADAGTEPGTATVTWCNGSPASVAAGTVGVSLGPLTPVTLDPGYKLTGTVLAGTVTDQWTSAAVWVDESPWQGNG